MRGHHCPAADHHVHAVRPPHFSTDCHRRAHRGQRSHEARQRRSQQVYRRVEANLSVRAPYGGRTSVDLDMSDIVSPEPPQVPDCGEDIRAVDARDEATRIHDHEPHDNVSPSPGLCEAGPVSIFGSFQILHCNIRGMLSHRAELNAQIQLLHRPPAMICINETFLDESVTDGQILVTGYRLVSRRDRADGRSGGGIMCMVHERYHGQVVMQEHSSVDERTWHVVHSDIGPILCGTWYRPPCPGETASILACEEELRRLMPSAVACIIVGDLNVHHTRWLKFSSSVTVEGTAMLRFCKGNGLKQRVKRPTRYEYLLDLVLTDIDPTHVQVLHTIADHNLVLSSFDFSVPEAVVLQRLVFDYSKASWDDIAKEIAETDWTAIDRSAVDEGERFFHNTLNDILTRHIPQRWISERKSKHPWVNDRCLQAIATKNSMSNKPNFHEHASKCSQVLFEEFVAHALRMPDKLARERRGSKGWWRIANEIVEKDGKATSIPALKVNGEWIQEPRVKANAFADTFSSKFVLPALEQNEYSAPGLPWSLADFYWCDLEVSNGFCEISKSIAIQDRMEWLHVC